VPRKVLKQRLPYILLLVLYLFSLNPVGKIVVNDTTEDLRETIRSLKTLQQEASGSSNDGSTSLRRSIQALQTLAGVYTPLLKERASEQDEPLLFMIVYRWSYLPAGEIQLPDPGTGRYLSFPPYVNYYLSFCLEPITPPPLFV